MTFLATVAGLLLLIPFPAFAADFTNVTYHRCYDDDTCTFTISDVHPSTKSLDLTTISKVLLNLASPLAL